jgi:tetratricopeptide (TPR) repeat protein
MSRSGSAALRQNALFLLVVLGSGLLGTGTLVGCSLIPRVVVPHDPLTTEEHVALGEAYRVKGLHDAAEKEFQAALHRDQNHVPALVALGNLAFESGGLPSAEEYYRRALRQAPDHTHANNNLAMVYIAKGERLDEAESLARAALKGPATLRPYVLDTLISIYLKQGRAADAERTLDEAERSVSPDQAPLREHFKALRAELTTRPSTH